MRDPSWLQLSDEIRAKHRVPGSPATASAEPPAAPGAARLEAAPVDDRPYDDAWAAYRAHWRSVWITSAGGWLTIAGLALLLPKLGAERVLSVLFPIWGMVWFGTSMYAVVKILAFSCPRCGNAFFTPFKSPIMQWKCRSCGLRKFSPNDRPPQFNRIP